MKILAVEDDAVAQLVLDASLRSLGHEVLLTGNAEAAWSQMIREPVRIIVSDWKLPGMDGLELCRRVRALEGDYTYFILLTQMSATEENQLAAVDAGVDDFITKPILMRDLKMRLHVAARILAFTSQVRQLQKILPLCGYCKRVRDDKSYWHLLESYISTHTGSSFSHGVCPECYNLHVKPVLEETGPGISPDGPGPALRP